MFVGVEKKERGDTKGQEGNREMSREKRAREQNNTNIKQFPNGKRETVHDGPMATKTRTEKCKEQQRETAALPSCLSTPWFWWPSQHHIMGP